MARYYLLVLRAINALVFIWVFLIFSIIFDFNMILYTADNELVLIAFLESIRNVLIYALYLGFYFIGIGIAYVSTIVFNPLPYYFSDYMFNFVGFFFKNLLNLWFRIPNGQAATLDEVFTLIFEELLVFVTDFYLFSFQILILISIVYAIRAALQNDPKYTLIAIGSLVAMIVVPLMVFGFKDMLELFTIKIEYLEELPYPINPILGHLPINNFFAFLASPSALLAIVSYIYLEISFQVNYADTVTKPSLERRDRLEAQLELLRRESVSVTANVEKIQKEAKKKREELGIERQTLGSFFSKAGARFSYVKEMIEKKKLEMEEQKLVTAASKTRRLGKYIERLFREDPESRDTLTARTSAPQAKGLAFSTVFTLTYRLFLLIILSFIIIHPHYFFKEIFNLPPAITESISMYSPEVIITLLIPIMLLFPVISQLISYIKHRNLVIRLKQEGRIKEIIASVGDYVKVEEEKDEVEQETASETSEVATETA